MPAVGEALRISFPTVVQVGLGVVGLLGVLLLPGVLRRWRIRRYETWMSRGRQSSEAADYGKAAVYFRRAARAQPHMGVAWYRRAVALLEAGRGREALEVVDEARQGEAVIDKRDFLAVEARAAREVEDMERCREALRDLAEGGLGMARSLSQGLGLGEAELGGDLARRLSVRDEGEEWRDCA